MAHSLDTFSLLRAFPVSVFVNPEAGGGRARAHLSRVQKLFLSLNISAEIVSAGSAGELESSVREAVSRGSRILFAMGGDGTFQALANASFGSDVLLGILPAGGGNDFAAALGISGNLQEALDGIPKYAPRCVDLVRVHTADGKTRLYAGGGGIGLDAEAARLATGNYRHLPGRIRYLAAALHALSQFRPLRVRIEFPETDVQAEEANCLLSCVLNTPTYGGGLRLAPDARVDDTFLDISLVEPLGLLGVAKLLPRLLGTGELRTTRIKRWQAKRVRFVTDRPCSFHGDGEILGPAPVQIEVVPRAVQVLAPCGDRREGTGLRRDFKDAWVRIARVLRGCGS